MCVDVYIQTSEKCSHDLHSCYLNFKTSFIWSLIAPVILVFLANIGFLVMALVIIYRHQKRQHIKDKMQKFK